MRASQLLVVTYAYYCWLHTTKASLYCILLSRLQSRFGLDGAVLSWIWFFLTDRTQRVCFGGCLSAEIALLFGIPHGSVLGPLLCLLYAAELFDIIASLGLTGHSYADDTQAFLLHPLSSLVFFLGWIMHVCSFIGDDDLTSCHHHLYHS